MNMLLPVKRMKGILAVLMMSAILFLFLSCNVGVEFSEQESDYIEFESVWQYLKAYSIHQERLPQDPFAYKTPADVMTAVYDTLKGNPYTHYFIEPAGGGGAQVASLVAEKAAYATTAFFDSLTDSTACLTDTLFGDDTWGDIWAARSKFAKFTNIIIDLRHNGGGRLDILDSIVFALVPKGTGYIQARYRGFSSREQKYITYDWDTMTTTYGPLPEFAKKKFVVIMDERTASASEILAAALYEGTKNTAFPAKLIGTKSYGKGIGQIILERRTRAPLQITFMQIKGVSSRIGDYHVKGIQPDLVPASIKATPGVDTLTPWHKEIFYAAKMLQPNVTPSSIKYPPVRIRTSGAGQKVASGLYKRVQVEDMPDM